MQKHTSTNTLTRAHTHTPIHRHTQTHTHSANKMEIVTVLKRLSILFDIKNLFSTLPPCLVMQARGSRWKHRIIIVFYFSALTKTTCAVFASVIRCRCINNEANINITLRLLSYILPSLPLTSSPPPIHPSSSSHIRSLLCWELAEFLVVINAPVNELDRSAVGKLELVRSGIRTGQHRRLKLSALAHITLLPTPSLPSVLAALLSVVYVCVS